MISPSTVAVKAVLKNGVLLEDKSIHIELSENSSCSLCGIPLESGDKAAYFKPGVTFNDIGFLANQSSKHACVDCDQVTLKRWLNNGKTGLFSPEGAFVVRKGEGYAHVILNPPEPPFILTCGASMNSQHVIWKARVSVSKDIIYFQRGDYELKINRHNVFSLRDSIVLLEEYLKDNFKKYKESKFPVAFMDFSGTAPSHGKVNAHLLKLLDDTKYKSHVKKVLHASHGDLWGAYIISRFKPSNESFQKLTLKAKEKPEKKTIKQNARSKKKTK